MRNIKFRAWNKEENIMYDQDNLIVSYSHLGNDCYVNTKDDVRPLYLYTLMQYTDIKDSNGTEIYEGDIVKIEDQFGDDIIGRVIYDETTAGYVFHKGNERNYFQMTLDLESYVYYVIGNIYENTELLEEVMETH